MKLAVTSSGANLDSEVDPRFGRCQYITFVDSDTMQFEAVQNAGGAGAGGAGIAAGQLVVARGAQVVLTGECGPNAHQVLSAANIQVITGMSGKVREAIEAYKTGRYKATLNPTVPAHFGQA